MAPPGPITIVLADDDDDLRAVMGEQLRAVGMTVWEAADGDLAVDLVRDRRPSVLVLDLWMPRLDGLKVLDALRFDPAALRLAIVVLTGDGEADGRLRSLAGGASEIVLKGGPIEELIGAIRAGADRAAGLAFGVDVEEPEDVEGREAEPLAAAAGPDLDGGRGFDRDATGADQP